MKGQFLMQELFELLPVTRSLHSRNCSFYKLIEKKTKNFIESSNLNIDGDGSIDLGMFGKINLPFYKMGNINSLDLFGLDELIIFAFYQVNKGKYSSAADIGANIGLHSIIMSKCGWNVNSYEPDPLHQQKIIENLSLNNITHKVNLIKKAVSNESGTGEFSRVVSNTTSSHLTGAKNNVYGDIDKFKVEIDSIKPIMKNFDFIKMDVEGQEAKIIGCTEIKDWEKTDMMVEIGSEENAKIVFEHLQKIKVNCFSQKNNWNKVTQFENFPTSYKEGSLFISLASKMNWG